MKLLVVDDNPDILIFLSSAMARSGHTVDTARDGVEAINLQLNNLYDVIVTDADMPRFDGLRLCKFIKMRFPGICIIGMSGTSEEKAFKNAGADAYLRKPFSIGELQKAVDGCRPSPLATKVRGDEI